MLNVSPKLLKHIAAVGTLTAFTWMGTALAQTPTPSSPEASPSGQASPMAGPTNGQTDSMERYLNNHPKEAEELHKDPSLINNPQWLAQHPTVKSWMDKHPNVRQDAIRNPNNFVHQTERETVVKDHQALNSTDRYLEKHPDVARDLNKDPKLIDNPQFRASHPGLNNYLNQHPGVAQEWKDHPERFAEAARANERYDRTGQVPHVHHARREARK